MNRNQDPTSAVTKRRDNRWKVRVIILALLAAAKVAVEMTVASSVQSELQLTADAAALAGAAHFLQDPDDSSGARLAAVKFAQMNPVRGRTLAFDPSGVAVDLDSGRVTVRMHTKVLRLPAPLAWLRVSAEATAEAMAAWPDPEKRPPRMKKLRLIDE